MTESHIRRSLAADFESPGSLKSGEYLSKRVHATFHAALLRGERDEVLDVLRDWLSLRQEPHTMLAVSVIREGALAELGGNSRALKDAIISGQCFRSFYLHDYELALDALGDE